MLTPTFLMWTAWMPDPAAFSKDREQCPAPCHGFHVYVPALKQPLALSPKQIGFMTAPV